MDPEYAFEFLSQNVNMNEGFVRFEVNRYLGWPGQAPSYKVGQRIWEQLRDEMQSREGDEFEIANSTAAPSTSAAWPRHAAQRAARLIAHSQHRSTRTTPRTLAG